MSDSDKPAPNQTIQLDALDPAEAERLVASPSSPPSEGAHVRRKTPPPLPPSALVANPPGDGAEGSAADGAEGAGALEAGAPVAAVSRAPRAPSVAPAAPRSSAQKAGMAVAFVVLVVGAIAGGLYVGGSARGKMSKSESAAATPSAAAPAPSASDNVLMLPTIEMGSTKQQ
jgi:hypothetical protein